MDASHFSARMLNRWWLPGFVALGSLLVLMLAIPYATGYGFERKSIATLLYIIWDAAEGNEHIVFVPFLCAFMVYTRREELARVPIEQGWSWAGLATLLTGAFIFWVGLRVGRVQVSYLAIQVLLAGYVIWFWGWRMFMAVLAIWAFFLFFWPVADQLGDFVGYPLRVLMSHISTFLLNLIGIPTILNGTGLHSAPTATAKMGEIFQVGIADACSGIRSLYALMMISVLYGFFALDRSWERWVVFLCAFPIAVVGNVARIMGLTLGTIYFGAPFAIGTEKDPSTYHMGCGFAVFAVAFGLLMLIGKFMHSAWFRTQVESAKTWIATAEPTERAKPKKVRTSTTASDEY